MEREIVEIPKISEALILRNRPMQRSRLFARSLPTTSLSFTRLQRKEMTIEIDSNELYLFFMQKSFYLKTGQRQLAVRENANVSDCKEL